LGFPSRSIQVLRLVALQEALGQGLLDETAGQSTAQTRGIGDLGAVGHDQCFCLVHGDGQGDFGAQTASAPSCAARVPGQASVEVNKWGDLFVDFYVRYRGAGRVDGPGCVLSVMAVESAEAARQRVHEVQAEILAKLVTPAQVESGHGAAVHGLCAVGIFRSGSE
jgi:hypothetical protein